MKPLVLFFSCEPGGAEVLIPVIQLLKLDSDFRVLVLGYGLGGDRFSRADIDFVKIDKVMKSDNDIFEKIKPSILITSAASLPDKDMSEKHLWLIARENNIPSIAFLDQWQNYVPRFSGTETNERLKYLPDIINCINMDGKNEMLAEGFPESKLKPMGHPYLSGVKKISNAIDANRIRKKICISNNVLIALFVSEPILENYGDTRGYDQYQVLALFLLAISESEKDYLPVIKLHPKDNIGKFEDILNKYKNISPIIIKNELTSLEVLSISDLVIGMSSVMLIEAYILECFIISLQPNLKIKDPFILSRLNLTPLFVGSKKFSICDISCSALNDRFDYTFNICDFKGILKKQYNLNI